MHDTKTPVPSVLLRAARAATGSLDAIESLSRLLEEAAGAVGARAGVVVGAGDRPARAVWGCDPAALDPLLAEEGAIRRAMLRQGEWPEGGLPLSRARGEPGWGAGDFHHLLLLPLSARALPVGAMALLYDATATPSPDDCDRATLCAGLAALILDNDRLYEEARAAQQARDHFLTAINHELRTPATAFLLTADLVRSLVAEPLPPRIERLLHDAESQISLMVEVLRRVLDLGSLGAHADSERSDILQPRQMVADLMRRLEPTAKRKSVALALYTPRDIPPLQTDADRFSRIVVHLLSNAIKFTPAGRVEVRLERTSTRLGRARPEPVLAIRVRDSGPGIPSHELERIFEPFTQVDEGARTDSRRRGLGLGLPLARQLARTLGGDVTLESALGRGTTASLLLPYHQQGAG